MPRKPNVTCCGCARPFWSARPVHQSTRCRDCLSKRKGRTCEACGAQYDAAYSAQRACGRDCGTELRRRAGNLGAGSLARVAKRPVVWPSSKVYISDCPACGVPVASRQNRARYCIRPDCVQQRQRAMWAKDKRRHGPVRAAECAACGEAFTTRRDTKRFCSEVCEKRTSRRSRRHYRERARRAGVAYEPVDKRRVFDRDRWRCGLCRRKVDPLLAYPDPMSASLDHIHPMSLGGAHTHANVHLAHLRCNLDKGVDGQWEQLALIG